MRAKEQRRRAADRDKNLVGFTIGDLSYAVEIARVREIVRPLPVVALPHAPPSVIGVADHRGEVVPVLDVRRRLGLPPTQATRRTKWILVHLARRSAALVVDAVTDVFAATQDEKREVPAVGSGDTTRGFSAVYGHRGTLVFVIDVDRIAAAADLVELPATGSLLRPAPPEEVR